MPKIQITSKGIKAALKKYVPHQSLVEYIWNGFDAQASNISITYSADEIGNIDSIAIADNGYGIPHGKLQDKFEPLFESKKALENKLKKNQSAIHGKNGIGRLTFFTFARNASWKTVYSENGLNWTYEIYANSENINLYTGVNAIPKKTDEATGTTVIFSGIHGLTAQNLKEKFHDYLLKEFAWFLALNCERNFSITVNGEPLDFTLAIADQEAMEIIHEDSATSFSLRYIRWAQRPNNEPSRYYYLNKEHKERWKEPTIIKNKGEQFYHSVFIESPYFNSFAFQSLPQENQAPLLSGTRSDKQFKFLRKKLANILRIKRRPFLKVFAEQLFLDYEQKNILPSQHNPYLPQTIKTLYEIQPKIFAALNLEQRKLLIGLLNSTLDFCDENIIPKLISNIVELSDDEKHELENLFSENNN